MRLFGFDHSPFTPHDPVRAVEEDIRRYLIRCGVFKPSEPRTLLCLLSIYVAIALVVALGSFLLARLECDALFSDRGLTVACRNHTAALAKIIGPASTGYLAFPSINMQ